MHNNRNILMLIIALIVATATNLILSNLPIVQASSLLQSTATPDPVLQPTISYLQNSISTQQVEIQSLQRDLAFQNRDINWKFLVAGVILAITGFTGYQAYRWADEKIRRRILVLINKHYYQLDITNLRIHIHSDSSLDSIEQLLKKQGLYKISRYDDLDSRSYRGITIVPISSANEEKDLLEFIRHNKFNPSEAGFIIYSTNFRISGEIFDLYSAVALTNTPWSLVSTLTVLGRSLTPPIPTDVVEDVV